MEIVVSGRHVDVADRFRQHAVEKLSKMEKFDHKVIRLEVEVSKERNPRQADQCDRIELTCRSKGPVIRAEACSHNPYAALDLACTKLEHRLRRLADRRRVHHGLRTPPSVRTTAAPLDSTAAAVASLDALPPAASVGSPIIAVPETVLAHDLDEAAGEAEPLIVREKQHRADPMTLDQALFEMELVGHDFYLFCDKETELPSVVYRRHAYDYGVIRLETTH
ncbi:ribosome-associated translation inhibitor RaiA [Acidothermaceae bacterium B102]|nr:ribosome-associated translation inhibitor RaiA [Acidothermaceae bacterium B102]